MAHFDPYWNKDNKRVSGMFQEVVRRKEEEAAAAMRKPPPSTLLDGLHETNAGRRWRGGALQRLNATLNAQPRAVPPARPPAPTTDRRNSVGPVPTPGTNTLSRGYAPKAPGEQCTNEEIARKKEAALIRRLERERLEKEELQRKLDAALNQHHHHQQQQQTTRGHANLTPNQPSAPQSAPKRTNPMVSLTAGKRPALSSGRPVAQHPGDDKLWPDQLFEIDIVLADDPAQAKEGDKLIVKAKSFPGYPAHAVLMDGSLRAGDMRKTLVEKGVVATWEVKPTAMYRPLVTRATREKLLRVDDRVSEKVAALRATADAAENRLKRAMDDVRTHRMEVPHDVRELVETARGTNTNTNTKPRKPGGRGGKGGRGRGRGASGRDETSEPAAPPRFRSFAAADEEEKVGGLGESDLVAAIAFALRSTPGAKVNPATADAKALVRVLRHVQTQMGVPLGVSAKTDPRYLKLAPVVSRAVLKVGFDPTFGETKETERASGKESIASWFNEPAEPEPAAPVTALESAPESSRDKVDDRDGERADPEVIDLLSDDEAGASTEQPARHLPGSLVVVRGLISRPDLNGDVFEVRAWSTERSRYRLAQAGGGETAREIYAKPENVSAFSAEHAFGDDAGAPNRGAAEEPVITIDDEEDEGPVCGQMSDDDLRELVIDQLRLASEEDRLERTTVRQIMDTLEKTYLVSLSGDRKSVVRECVDTYIAERTNKAREEEGRVAVECLRREGLVDTIRRAATELIEAKKALRRIEEATKPRETRKRREPTAPTYDSADYVQLAPNSRTGAGMTWEGAGGMSFGPNVEDFY